MTVKQHGGKREGAGRKKFCKWIFVVRVPSTIGNRIEKLSRESNYSLVIRELLERGLASRPDVTACGEPCTWKFCVRLPGELGERIERLSKELDASYSDVIRSLLESGLASD